MNRFTTLSLLLALSSASAAQTTTAGDKKEENVPHHQPARLLQTGGERIDQQYIVKLTEGSDRQGVMDAVFADNPTASVIYEYSYAMNGFTVSGVYEETIMNIADRFPGVVLEVEEDAKAVATEQLVWGLDRIDDTALVLDGSFVANVDGSDVDVYIMDTGLRATHVEFEGRVKAQVDFTVFQDNVDGTGHGTHVTGIATGQKLGVANNAWITAVRVLGPNGVGTNSAIIAGIDYVTKQHLSGHGRSVANMSLGGPFSMAMNSAVAKSAATGVIYTVAAGNSNRDACTSSPASEPSAITVGATTVKDSRAGFSNYGTCVDIWAPGSEILSASGFSDTAFRKLSGTSMSAPYVAGAAAMLLQAEPTMSGLEVRDQLISMGAAGVLQGDIGAGSPNLLLYTGDIGEVTIADTPLTDAPDWKGRVALAIDGTVGLQRGWFHCRGKCGI